MFYFLCISSLRIYTALKKWKIRPYEKKTKNKQTNLIRQSIKTCQLGKTGCLSLKPWRAVEQLSSQPSSDTLDSAWRQGLYKYCTWTGSTISGRHHMAAHTAVAGH